MGILIPIVVGFTVAVVALTPKGNHFAQAHWRESLDELKNLMTNRE